jgi:glycosyltransferase involved in cell wall biosynthesis
MRPRKSGEIGIKCLNRSTRKDGCIDMRILNICTRIDKKSGGGSVAVLEVARMLRDAGADVQNWIITHPSDGELLSTEDLNTRWFSASRNSSRYRFSSGFFIALLKKIDKFDLIIISGLYLFPNTLAGLLGRLRGIPYVLFPYDSYNPEKMQHGAWKKLLYRKFLDDSVLRGAKLVHAANLPEREQILSYGASNEIFCAPYGFRLRDFQLPRSKSLLDRFCPWDPSEQKIILYLARVSKTKGVEVLIDAFRQLIAVDPAFRLLIVGPEWDVEYHEDLLKHCRDLTSNGYLNFAGMVSDDEKYACFQNSFIYVLPSFSENFGITVLEAVANRLVCVVTEAVPWEDLESSGAGYRVAVRDSGAISAAVQAYSALSPSDQDEMRDRAFSLAEQYDRDSLAPIYFTAFEAVARKGRL